MGTALAAAFLPQIASAAIGILVPLLVALIVKQFQKFGIEIEAKNREALQSALQNAAITAVSKATGSKTANTTLAENKATVDNAVDYVKQSVPDAIKKFKLDPQKIKKLLEPHLAKAVDTLKK